MSCADSELEREAKRLAEKERRQRQNANNWAIIGAPAGAFVGGVAVVIAILFKIVFLDGCAPEFSTLVFVFLIAFAATIALAYKYGWDHYKKPL